MLSCVNPRDRIKDPGKIQDNKLFFLSSATNGEVWICRAIKHEHSIYARYVNFASVSGYSVRITSANRMPLSTLESYIIYDLKDEVAAFLGLKFKVEYPPEISLERIIKERRDAIGS